MNFKALFKKHPTFNIFLNWILKHLKIFVTIITLLRKKQVDTYQVIVNK